ncbi:hypothetical protein AVEN_252373-1 [Araneus ventricosus]|uniref:Uncharacterized protein n=1 Tax=Araneus ventricosus TaxID=182803 RepID=A0A4Y2ASE1_ARAVE|nr:hypothetical protein AVEN_252373-1 [Araneus ventricosus]
MRSRKQTEQQQLLMESSLAYPRGLVGSPTKTLLRLLLPLNDQVWSSFRHTGSTTKANPSASPKTSLNHSIGSSDGQCGQRADEIKSHNTQTLKEQLPTIIKEAACPDIKSTIETVNREIIAEVKKNRVEARSFAQVALQAKDKRQGASTILTPKEPEGILLIKPKDDALKDFEIKRKIILDILQANGPEARLRGVVKIFERGQAYCSLP